MIVSYAVIIKNGKSYFFLDLIKSTIDVIIMVATIADITAISTKGGRLFFDGREESLSCAGLSCTSSEKIVSDKPVWQPRHPVTDFTM